MTTTEAPAYTHTDTCDLIALGRNVRAWVAHYGTTGDNPLRYIVGDTDAFRGPCDCKSLALSRVDTALRCTRKAARAATAAGDLVGFRRATAQVAALVIERDRIRNTP